MSKREKDSFQQGTNMTDFQLAQLPPRPSVVESEPIPVPESGPQVLPVEPKLDTVAVSTVEPAAETASKAAVDVDKMFHGLAILTYVPPDVSPEVLKRLPEAIRTLEQSGYPGPVWIVDDGSTNAQHLRFLQSLRHRHNSERYAVVLRGHNGGIARAKNTCLRVLSDVVLDVGFIAEDDVAFHGEWWVPYLRAHAATGIHHFSWACDDASFAQNWAGGGTPKPIRKDVVEINGTEVHKLSGLNGVFLTFTPEVVEKVGGFKAMPAPWGHEHLHWSKRIVQAGLAPHWADVVGSNDLVNINQYGRHSAVPDSAKLEYVKQNREAAADLSETYLPLTE